MKSLPQANEHGDPERWILYDDSCGFCRRWATSWRNVLRKRGFVVAPLQSDWVPTLLNVNPGTPLTDLRLVLDSGEHILGADVYRYAMKRIWWAYPMYLFSTTPLCRQVFDWGYRTFAAHRYQLSDVCHLPGEGKV